MTARAIAPPVESGEIRRFLSRKKWSSWMGGSAPLGSEGGFALIGALLVAVLVTALGGAALFLAQMDLMLAGNYRVQRTAEASADGALDLVKAMIFSNAPQLNLPLSIPSTDAAAKAWRAGPDTDGDTIGDGVTVGDQDIDVMFTIRYKQEDNINYNAAETYADEVVRYGRDYNYQGAQKVIGKQPVYTVTFSDTRTGVKGEADLISTIGFNTPAALFCGGKVHMQKYAWATEESIEVVSGTGTPAVASASASASAITIETVKESTTFTGTTKLSANAALGATAITVDSTAGFTPPTYPAPVSILVGGVLWNYNVINSSQFICTPPPSPQPNPCSGLPVAAKVGTFVNVTSGSKSYDLMNYIGGCPPNPPTTANTISYAVNPSYLHHRVYRPSEVAGSKVDGLYNQAREGAHILLGVGDRNADLDIEYATAGGGSAGAAAANALFRFYNRTEDGLAGGYDVPVAFDNSVTPHQCGGIVCYNFQMPAAQAPLTQLETMFGQSFADLKSLADQEFTCTASSTLPGAMCNPISTHTCNLSGISLGTAAAPQVVYINGTGTADPVRLYTTAGTQVSGFGILIIDGDAEIVGSINWRGLMLIRGNLQFRPWQGGIECHAQRSGTCDAVEWLHHHRGRPRSLDVLGREHHSRLQLQRGRRHQGRHLLDRPAQGPLLAEDVQLTRHRNFPVTATCCQGLPAPAR